MIEFFIDRKGNLADGSGEDRAFASVNAAADFAIRVAQDLNCLYRIFYV